MRLEGEIALVTGSARGIGRSIAHAFAREGASVIISDRDAGAAEQARDTIVAAGGHAVSHRADVSEVMDIEALFGFCDARRIYAARRCVDIWINSPSASGATACAH